MEVDKAYDLFENEMYSKAVDIERCGMGIGNYVFVVTTVDSKYILRCSEEKKAFDETVYWLSELKTCNIPIPKVLRFGEFECYTYIILTYADGDDIGNVYSKLNDKEKKQIAKDVIEIQKRVSKINTTIPQNWSWDLLIDEMIDRAQKRISVCNYFDLSKIEEIRHLKSEIQEYMNSIKPVPYLDDISTKNLLVHNGKVSGVIDIDWMGFGDVLTFIAMTQVALLNMELDTKYVDYLLAEMHLSNDQNKAYIFYCLLFCIDFMGERGMKFLDKIIPVNQEIINRLNHIYDDLMLQWEHSGTVAKTII